MDLKLKDKVAVVLAASSGIGKGIAEVLAIEGCKIAICSRNIQELQKTANIIKNETKGQVFFLSTDVSNAKSLNDFFDSVFNYYGHVDILVNNAGGPPPGESKDFGDKEYYNAFEQNLMSVIRSCRRVLPEMVKQNWGRIISITSTSVKCVLENMILSNIFRNGVAAFSKSISMEYARNGIRVHCIMPGPFLTKRVNELGMVESTKKGISFNQWKKETESNTLLGRFGDPKELGNLAAFLSSDASEYMTGTCIAIDGGNLKTIN